MDCTCRNPIFCVVPPYVLTQVARRGSEKQREWALRSLDADTTIRHARAVNAKARGRKGPVEGPDALAAAAGPGVRNRIIWDARNKWEVTGLRRVRDEDDGPTGDPAVDEAFDGFGETWDFWQASSTSARSTTTRSGTAAGWCSATATARSSCASRSRST